MPRTSAPLNLEHILLAMLEPAPRHGYELYQELLQTQGIAKIWNITQSMLYVMLDRLEEGGLLVSTLTQGDAYPPRKMFQITPAGRTALQQWLRMPVRRARQMRQEFLAKLIIARRYGPSAALALIHAQQRACQGWLEQLQAGFAPQDAAHVDAWLVDTYRLHRLQALARWLEECEKEFS